LAPRTPHRQWVSLIPYPRLVPLAPHPQLAQLAPYPRRRPSVRAGRQPLCRARHPQRTGVQGDRFRLPRFSWQRLICWALSYATPLPATGLRSAASQPCDNSRGRQTHNEAVSSKTFRRAGGLKPSRDRRRTAAGLRPGRVRRMQSHSRKSGQRHAPKQESGFREQESGSRRQECNLIPVP